MVLMAPYRHPVEPVYTGDDIVRIFIDSDENISSGYLINPAPYPAIGADYKIELRGKYGEVLEHSLCRYIYNEEIRDEYYSDKWEYVIMDENCIWEYLGEVEFGKDFSRFETGIELNNFGGDLAQNYSIYFYATDWSNSNQDYSDILLNISSRSGNGSGSVLMDNGPISGTREEIPEFTNIGIPVCISIFFIILNLSKTKSRKKFKNDT